MENEDPLRDFITTDLGPAYASDLWLCSFVVECLKLFGAPISLLDCLSFEDEIYHTFCAAALVLAMKEFEDEWMEMRDMSPADAALEFAKLYKQERDDDLIPAMSPVTLDEELKI